ncbi:MAG TPA: ImmA/IrrE family metallo-endopeptidase [Planctomycetota bacterium]|nr:ImmA/IrrE family metallo-endopeptidase [Planctomycetota bacterium]
MNADVLARNVRRLRIARRLTQQDLAQEAGLSLASIKNIELARGKPRVSTLQEIARALGAKLQDLFLPVRELKTVRFRSGKRMRNRENILADVSRWLEDFNFLEGILDDRVPFVLGGVRRRCSRGNPAAAAAECRSKLGLKPTEPIYDICGLLEHAGVKVHPISVASDSFFGLSVGERDGGPAVVANVWSRISVERRIFSAVHELGHLMLHPEAYNVAATAENDDEENEANEFAGHFLLPDDGFRREWSEVAGLHIVQRVFKVKRIFNVSYKTVLNRLIERGIADNSIWRRFNGEYRRLFGLSLAYKEEPAGLVSAEPFGLRDIDFYEDRFSRLVRRAIEDEKITISRGAEILRIGVEEMEDLLASWEVVA